MRLARNLQHPGLLLTAHLALGMILYWRGEFTSARAHVEQGLSLYDPQQPPPNVDTADPIRADCLCYVAYALWHLGYPDQSLTNTQHRVAVARARYAGKMREMAVSFEDDGKTVTLITIHPLKERQKTNRIDAHRWIPYEKKET